MSQYKDHQQLKDQGNIQFKNGNFLEALRWYTEAIELEPTIATYYSNRAMTYLKLGNWKDALKDCEKGVEIDGTIIKLWFRKGIAETKLELFEQARESFTKGLLLDPSNEELKKQLESLPATSNLVSPKPETAPISTPSSFAAPKPAATATKPKKTFAEIKQTRDSKNEPSQLSKSVQIPIEIVESLPEFFKRKPSMKESGSSSASSPSGADIRGTFSRPSGPLSLYSLRELIRSPPGDLPEVYRYLLADVPCERFIEIHKNGGIEYDVIEFMLDAILYGSTVIPGAEWVPMAVPILHALEKCPRFSISQMMASSQKCKQVADELSKHGVSKEELTAWI